MDVDLGHILGISRRRLVTGGKVESIDSPVTPERAREQRDTLIKELYRRYWPKQNDVEGDKPTVPAYLTVCSIGSWLVSMRAWLRQKVPKRVVIETNLLASWTYLDSRCVACEHDA